MTKKLIKILLLIVLLMATIVYEYNKKPKQREEVSVYVLKDNKVQGDYLTQHDFEIQKLAIDYLREDMIKEASFQSGYLVQDSLKGTYLIEGLLEERNPDILKSKERLITVKCSVLEGNGWFADKGDVIDLLLIDKEENLWIRDAKVYKKFDEKLSDESLPLYYTLIVDEDEARLFYQSIARYKVYILVK